MDFHGKVSTAGLIDLKKLIDVNPVKMHGAPRALESLMYNYGHGFPKLPNDPAIMQKSVNNRRSLVEVDALDSSNYYNFRK
jgi:hypothetical protein